MSRRGNPYDNALAENFFSILKTECINRTKLKIFDEARKLIDDYIYFYNHQRIQLKTKLIPFEFRSQFGFIFHRPFFVLSVQLGSVQSQGKIYVFYYFCSDSLCTSFSSGLTVIV